MKLAESRITTQGQISVPAEVRRRLSLVPGSILEWELEGDRVVVRRAARFTSEEVHRALFARPPRSRTVAELKEGIRARMRVRRARR
jgi:antitoxin PrlF